MSDTPPRRVTIAGTSATIYRPSRFTLVMSRVIGRPGRAFWEFAKVPRHVHPNEHAKLQLWLQAHQRDMDRL